MPAYKEANNTWTSKFKYKDWLGNKQQKTKRGFARKKDADMYESDFKSRYVHSANILFPALYKNYIEDMDSNKK